MPLSIKKRHSESIAAYLFLLPNFLGFLIFTLLPVLFSLALSFTDWDLFSPPKFIGMANFVNLAGFHVEAGSLIPNDPLFWKYLGNTVFLMMVIPFEIFGALLLAMAMNQKIKGIVAFRTIYFLPSITNGAAICLMWFWIYAPEFGLLNNLIRHLGEFLHVPLEGVQWLTSTQWAKPSLMVLGLWVLIGGYNMILYLAALQGIPKDFYDAADIDGASGWHKFWHITWPMISPTTFFISIMAIIGGFQGGFMYAYMLTRGGPSGATTTLEYYIYNNLTSWQHAGYAACIAWFLFILIFIITIFNWRFGGKLVHY